jgi:peptidoglycan hydrolase-like protein with peptidoglycan-binding domain
VIVRRRTPLLVGLLVIGLGAGGALLLPALVAADAPEPIRSPQLATTPVTTGDMASETRIAGTINYAETVPIAAGTAGVITGLPDAGSSIGPGGVLYRVDTRPVLLLGGASPAWRDFTLGMTDGDDVVQLEENLVASGFLDETPNARFDADTASSVRAWQRSLGLEATGTVERSTVVFHAGELRIESVEARLGQDVAPGTVVVQATSPEKVVDLTVKSSDRSVAVAGTEVGVVLPGGSTVAGVVQTVGAPRSQPDADGGSSVIIPMRVGVADQAALGDLALAGVTVSVSSPLRDDVLTVPIDALVPLDDTRYAVQTGSVGEGGQRRLLPVTVGAASSGRVEISGDDIVEGLLVVVPER